MTARPGQIKAVLDVDIPGRATWRSSACRAFLELVDEIWKMIEEEVKAALQMTSDGLVAPQGLAT